MVFAASKNYWAIHRSEVKNESFLADERTIWDFATKKSGAELPRGFSYAADLAGLRGPEQRGKRSDKAHDHFVYCEPVEHHEGSEQHVKLGNQRRDQHLDCSGDIHLHRRQRIYQREPDDDNYLHPEGQE